MSARLPNDQQSIIVRNVLVDDKCCLSFVRVAISAWFTFFLIHFKYLIILQRKKHLKVWLNPILLITGRRNLEEKPIYSHPLSSLKLILWASPNLIPFGLHLEATLMRRPKLSSRLDFCPGDIGPKVLLNTGARTPMDFAWIQIAYKKRLSRLSSTSWFIVTPTTKVRRICSPSCSQPQTLLYMD